MAHGSKNKGNEEGVRAGMNTGENGGSPIQVEEMTLENRENSGRTNATVTNDANETDRMKTYNAKTGFIEVIFMTGNIKGFNVARALKQFQRGNKTMNSRFFHYRELATTCVSVLTYQTQRMESSNTFAIK
jgi:hypothetical protein